VKKNISSQSIGAEMVTAADSTAFTGAVSVFVTKDNGTQTAGGATAPTHEGNGYHSYSPTQAETNADHIAFTFTGTGAIPATVQLFTSFPQTQDHTAPIDNIETIADLIKSDTTSILVDTNDLQTNQGDWLTATGFNTVIPPSVEQFDARTLPSASYFNPTTDAVANVTLVGTTTTNTDMRGTNNALLAASYTAPDNAGITQIQADISALNDISVAQIFAGGDIDGYSLEESNKLILAASAGTLSGAATTTVTITAADGSKARLTATVDGDGNRSAVIKDATG
jgi:VCBS repeat-containing protein